MSGMSNTQFNTADVLAIQSMYCLALGHYDQQDTTREEYTAHLRRLSNGNVRLVDSLRIVSDESYGNTKCLYACLANDLQAALSE